MTLCDLDIAATLIALFLFGVMGVLWLVWNGPSLWYRWRRAHAEHVLTANYRAAWASSRHPRNSDPSPRPR